MACLCLLSEFMALSCPALPEEVYERNGQLVIPPPPSLCRDSQKLVTDPLAPLYAPAPRCRAGFVSTSLRDNWNSLRQNAAMQALHIPVKRRLVGSTPLVVPWCDPGR